MKVAKKIATENIPNVSFLFYFWNRFLCEIKNEWFAKKVVSHKIGYDNINSVKWKRLTDKKTTEDQENVGFVHRMTIKKKSSEQHFQYFLPQMICLLSLFF